MKTLISIIIGCILIFTSSLASAEKENYDWENDLDVYMNYNQSSGIIKVIATIPSQTNETNQFSLWLLYIDGREYKKYFHYNKTGKFLFVNFQIPESITISTDLTLSIRDTRYNIAYSTNIYNYNSGSSTVISVIEAPSIGSLSRTEIISIIQSGNYTKDDITEIKKAIKKYTISLWDFQSTPSTPVNPVSTWSYTPKYSSQGLESNTINGIGNNKNYDSQGLEPNTINGIGNNKNYDSWRVTY
jgi:hypothetical protein